MEGHKIILNDFLNALKGEKITSILDAGSGRTSLTVIRELFPDVPVDAVVYPGDVRKINSIAGVTEQHKNISVIEKDICGDIIDKKYDVVVAHLLLGEAAKFGNAFEKLLERIINIQSEYLIIIDYLEDPAVNENDILKACEDNNLTVVYRAYFTNEHPQAWEDFTGVHNFGYLIKKNK
ncbi:MAG: hypothetical protein J1E39_09060 [Eubacterium sp.]|nr:hypothetical protein [Eubacterium sp.]